MKLCKVTGTLINAVTYITPTLQNMRVIMCDHNQFSLETKRILSSSPTSTLSSGPEVSCNHEHKRFGNWYTPKDVKTKVHFLAPYSLQCHVRQRHYSSSYRYQDSIHCNSCRAVHCNAYGGSGRAMLHCCSVLRQK